MDLAVCVSAWNEELLLPGCLDSVAPLLAMGARLVVADGAYRLTLDHTDGKPWPEWRSTDGTRAVAAIHGATWVDAPAEPWPSEAEKKTALLDTARDTGARWALFIDADERMEYGACEATAVARIASLVAGHCWWATLEIYWPDGRGAGSNSYPLPRLLALAPAMSFAPPRDFEVWRDGHRIAFLAGEAVPLELRSHFDAIPPRVARLRHDRHLRPPERTMLSRAYMTRRKTQHDPSGTIGL